MLLSADNWLFAWLHRSEHLLLNAEHQHLQIEQVYESAAAWEIQLVGAESFTSEGRKAPQPLRHGKFCRFR